MKTLIIVIFAGIMLSGCGTLRGAISDVDSIVNAPRYYGPPGHYRSANCFWRHGRRWCR